MSEQIARDNALTTVLGNTSDGWKNGVRGYVKTIPVGTEVVGEKIRTVCLDRGLKPAHHNAWGAMIRTLVKEGYLEPVAGRLVAMEATGSHGRKTQVYCVRTPVATAA